MSIKKIERALEMFLFTSRWLMAPFYIGLVVALVALLAVFANEIVHTLPTLFSGGESAVVVWVLTLIDLSLAANLLLMVIFSGYENFVSKMDVVGHPDRPSWMGTIDFSGMKLKLIASIVAISAIYLLKSFMNIGKPGYPLDQAGLMWAVIIHLTFVLSGVLLALMDWVASKTDKH